MLLNKLSPPLICLLVGTLLFVMSCSQDTTELNQNMGNLLNYRINNQTQDQIIAAAQDEKDLAMRKVKWIFGQALAQVLKNKDYANLLIADAQKSALKEANLFRVAEQSANFKTDLNAQLAAAMPDSYKTQDEAGDLLADLSAQLVYDTTYLPVIVIPNLNTLNADLPPIVSPGVDLDADIDPTLDDDIFAVRYDANYQATDIILNETEALASTQPIFIFANGIDDTQFNEQNSGGDIVGTMPSNGSGKTNVVVVNIDEISVKSSAYYYDGGGGNNYVVVGVKALTNTMNITTMSNFLLDFSQLSVGPHSWIEVASFTSSQCNGVPKVVNKFLADEFTLPNNTSAYEKSIHFNTAERDWYGGDKQTGFFPIPYTANEVYTLLSRRNYTTETYLFGPFSEVAAYNSDNCIPFLWSSTKSSLNVVCN